MRRALPLALGLLLGATIGSNPAEAQIHFEGLEGSIGFVGWNGHDFQTLEEDFGFTLAPLLRVGRAWQVGIEGYAGNVGFERTLVDRNLTIRKSGDEFGVNALVRRIVGDPESRHLYLQMRAGWTELDTEVVAEWNLPEPQQDDVVETFSTTGFTVGPEVGVSFAPRRGLRVLLGAGITWNRYGDTEIFGPFDFTFGETTSAHRWGVRAGVMLGNPFG